MTGRREIVLINQQEGGPPSLLDKVEKLSKIASIIALPLIVGFGGWWIQDALSRRDTDQDYVELAISILSKPQDETQSELREWATNLLAEKSPIEFPRELKEKLGGGEVRLPTVQRSTIFAPASELSQTDPRSQILRSVSRFDARGHESATTCTAWLVSGYQVITAAHCTKILENEVEAARALFGYFDQESTDTTKHVDLALPATEINNSLDYAVFAFEKGASFSGIPLSISQAGPREGDKLFILHHPLGKELSFPVQPCRVLSIDAIHIMHNCDTVPGAGGAPLINADTLKVVGMHLGKGGDATNYGVRMDAVIADSRTLRELSEPAN